MPSNVSVAQFRAWKGCVSDPADSVIQLAIDAAEEAANAYCGRVFSVASGTSSARLYVPTNDRQNVLTIHDCVSISTIVDDGSALAASDWQAEPINGLLASGDTSPYTQVRLLAGAYWAFDANRATVSVTADWGWTALPDRYTNAVLILTADIVDQRALQNGVLGFTEYAGIRVRANPMVSSLLRKLRRAEAWGIG